MTDLTHVSWTTVVASAVLAVAVSPLLAGWSAALAEGQVAGWWRPRRVTVQRSAAVAAAAAVLGALAGAGGPWPAWWLFAAGGCVLAVVDAEKHVLPSRLLYPLAALEAVVLIVTAVVDADPHRLVRAAIAAAVLGAGWFVLAFVAGGGIGLGDVRTAAMTGALLGWLGWPQVLHGQLVAVALAAVTAGVTAVLRPAERRRTMRVPLGPALVVATLLMCWT